MVIHFEKGEDWFLVLSSGSLVISFWFEIYILDSGYSNLSLIETPLSRPTLRDHDTEGQGLGGIQLQLLVEE